MPNDYLTDDELRLVKCAFDDAVIEIFRTFVRRSERIGDDENYSTFKSDMGRLRKAYAMATSKSDS